MAIDPYDKGDIQSDIRRAEDLLQSGIFDPSNAQSALFRAAFVDLLIALRDLMYKTEKYSRRITFTDDVSLTDTFRRGMLLPNDAQGPVCRASPSGEPSVR